MIEKILFLCTGNSCRSQMAEAFAKEIFNPQRLTGSNSGKPSYEIYSAGIEAHGLNPYAIKVMSEVHIDITSQKSEILDETLLDEVDLIVTVCGDADRNCPAYSGRVKKLHWPLDDPAKVQGAEPLILEEFRRVRDEIRQHVLVLKRDLLQETGELNN